MFDIPVYFFEVIIDGYKYLFLSINFVLKSYGWSIIFISFAVSFVLLSLTCLMLLSSPRHINVNISRGQIIPENSQK